MRVSRGVGKIALLILVSVLMFGIGEAVYRLLGYWKNGTFQGLHEYDAELGWQTTRKYRGKNVSMRDWLGQPYQRLMQTDARGSRLWGTRPGAPRLLFLGDSFTEAIEVSNDKTYGAVFASLSDFDVYVYGTGAYGSLQEAMMLERLVGEVRPDVLVLQFARNDFTNNSRELERQTVLFQQMIRPYLVLGNVDYRYPELHPYRLALRYSRFFSWLDAMVGVLLYRIYGDLNRLSSGPELALLEKQATAISQQILHRIASAVPRETRLYAFNRDESHAETNRIFEEIGAREGFRVIRTVAAYVDAQESRVETTLAADGIHLNERGNRLLGERLARYFTTESKTQPVHRANEAAQP